MTLTELTEILEMALLYSSRKPTRVKLDGVDYLLVSRIKIFPAPDFSAPYWEPPSFAGNLRFGLQTQAQKAATGSLPTYTLDLDTRISDFKETLAKFEDHYKDFKGKALYKLFMLRFLRVLFTLTFEFEPFTTAVKVKHVQLIYLLKETYLNKLTYTEYETLFKVSLLTLNFEVSEFTYTDLEENDRKAYENLTIEGYITSHQQNSKNLITI